MTKKDEENQTISSQLHNYTQSYNELNLKVNHIVDEF